MVGNLLARLQSAILPFQFGFTTVHSISLLPEKICYDLCFEKQ
ncbi:hypothetical protein C900_00813 [Fulvivirga imtechensis AK7]|uniref:Uncharacterized protein n=1 Tax=Fulvivirga imtechensis AK7 TaxID=1237149 RepID=L8K055_9BACT|nr:hypothetical protein C900_00813 [Fulvivirga imtechensis AK7]